MSQLKIYLFGKFRIQSNDHIIDHFYSAKAQELFCQILLRRERPFSRETLAGMLWGDVPTSQSRKYLRQTLWKLQSILSPVEAERVRPVLLVEPEWVQFNAQADVWVDLIAFERIYLQLERIQAQDLEPQAAESLKESIQLYQGDLLENCYQDWCIFERERFQNMYLASLEKLMDYGEAHATYSEAIGYGSQILRMDRARERTHRQMIRLHLLSGQRTEALRQYERCYTALSEDLGVAPSAQTSALLEQARSEHGDLQSGTLREPEQTRSNAGENPLQIGDILNRLYRLRGMLTSMQQQIYDEIRVEEEYLHRGNGAVH